MLKNNSLNHAHRMLPLHMFRFNTSQSNMEAVDVIIIGAGAAGLMCAIEAGKRYRKVLVLDHANKAGKKF